MSPCAFSEALVEVISLHCELHMKSLQCVFFVGSEPNRTSLEWPIMEQMMMKMMLLTANGSSSTTSSSSKEIMIQDILVVLKRKKIGWSIVITDKPNNTYLKLYYKINNKKEGERLENLSLVSFFNLLLINYHYLPLINYH